MTLSHPPHADTADVASPLLPGAKADFHSRSVEDTLATLGTPPGGLHADETAKRRAAYGANRLPEPPAVLELSLKGLP